MAEFYKIAEHTLTNIADAMRAWTQKTDKITPDEMPQEVNRVFDAGADIGYTTGYDHGKEAGIEEGYKTGYDHGTMEGIEEGRRAEWNDFWDSVQNYGKRTNYTYGFAGVSWTNRNFKPKYNMSPTSAVGMFHSCACTDIVKALDESGVTLDFSKATNVVNLLTYCSSVSFPDVDFSNLSSIASFCSNNSALKSLKIKISTKLTNANNAFQNCTALGDFDIDGEIKINGFNFSSCTKLNKASIESIVNAASTTASITITLSSVAVKREFETSAGANDGNTSQAWKDLIATRPTVTFALS